MFSMSISLKDKEELAQFVNDLLLTSGLTSVSIMITNPERSGDYSVSIATDTSSADTVVNWVQTYYGLVMTTSLETTQAG